MMSSSHCASPATSTLGAGTSVTEDAEKGGRKTHPAFVIISTQKAIKLGYEFDDLCAKHSSEMGTNLLGGFKISEIVCSCEFNATKGAPTIIDLVTRIMA